MRTLDDVFDKYMQDPEFAEEYNKCIEEEKKMYFKDLPEEEQLAWKPYLEFDSHFPDGRMAFPNDGPQYRWRDMIDLCQKLGRPLTEEEAEQFRV